VAARAAGADGAATAALVAAAKQDPDLCDPRLWPDTGRGVIRAVERALRDYPNQQRVRGTVAHLYLAARLWREAEAAATDILATRRGDLDALIVAGRARLGRGQPEAALEVLDRALAVAPERADVRAARAEALLALGRGAEAEVELEKAVGVDPRDALSLGRLAARLWDRGQADRAEELWRYALRRDANLAGAHYGLAQVHERQARLAEAEEAFKAARQLEPANPRYHEALAMFFERHGRRAEAPALHQAGRQAATLQRATEHRRRRAQTYLAGLERAAARARAGDTTAADRALRALPPPRGPAPSRAATWRRGPVSRRWGRPRRSRRSPRARFFAAGNATLLVVTGPIAGWAT